jgi:hypothetical protein
MHWDAIIFAAIVVIAFFWIDSKFNRIIGQLEAANETLASILDEVQK